MGAPREYLEAKFGMHNVYTKNELQEKGFKICVEIDNHVTMTKDGKTASCLKQDDPPLYYDLK